MAAQWSEHEARVVLHAWQVSGQSIEKFASQRGLVPQRLRRWKKKLEDVAAPGLEHRDQRWLEPRVAAFSKANVTAASMKFTRADVLSRMVDHPHAQLDELLPGAWAKSRA